jgi:hypothetical protein
MWAMLELLADILQVALNVLRPQAFGARWTAYFLVEDSLVAIMVGFQSVSMVPAS